MTRKMGPSGPCTWCGALDHWRPDCPGLAEFVKERREAMNRGQHKARIESALEALKREVAEARGEHGRGFIRDLPQGKLLDALDAGKRAGYVTDAIEEMPDR